jgi:hypothetical protein
MPRPRAAFGRFLWKEYRTLRGFWLAIGGLAVAEQCVSKLAFLPGEDLPLWLFSSALGAAALYGIGASAVLFSNEHEEQTYSFLSSLPATWAPLFFGKLALVALSAAVLAAVLVTTGVAIGGRLLNSVHARDMLVVLGFAMVEGIAWGTLCSLRFKQPLVAALLAVTATAIATQLLVSSVVSGHTQALALASYREALPARIGLATVVFAAGVWSARRWLPHDAPDRIHHSEVPRTAAWSRWFTRQSAAAPRSHNRTGRLLWQTWREARWLLGLPLLVTVALWILIGAAAGLSGARNEIAAMIPYCAIFMLPTLYGAFAFYTDLRQHGYRFFAQHGIGGRRIWLVRNAVWLAALGAVLAAIAAGCIVLFAWAAMSRTMEIYLHDQRYWWQLTEWGATSRHNMLGGLLGSVTAAYGISGKVLLAPLAAFALGQFCSMAIRSQVLAAFVAIVMSTVLAAWMVVVFAWQLSAWWFVLPIAAALFAATWLRAPDWLIERNALWAWIGPVLAVVVPLAVMVLSVPSARLAQLHAPVGEDVWEVNQLATGLQQSRESSDAETVALYERAIDLMDTGLENDPLEPWEQKLEEAVSSASSKRFMEIKNSDEYSAAQQEFMRLVREQNQQVLDLLVEAAGRLSNCRFDFHAELATTVKYSPNTYNDHYWPWNLSDQQYRSLQNLLLLVQIDGDTVDEFFAGLTLSNRMRAGQPVFIFVQQLAAEELILQRFAGWAAEPERTDDELRIAANRWQGYVAAWPSPEASIIADYQLAKKTIAGELTPLMYYQEHIYLAEHLTAMANEFSWERERGQRALDVLVVEDLDTLAAISEPLYSNFSRLWNQSSGDTLRARLSAAAPHAGPRFYRPSVAAARTSYLARSEYECRVSIGHFLHHVVNAEARRRGFILQLAAARYDLDHEEPLAALDQLVPDYLPMLPFDPYTGESFRYEVDGLPLPFEMSGLRIEPNTPFVWSPGLGGADFIRETSRSFGGDPNDEEPTVTEQYVTMHNREPILGWDPEDLVFTFARPATEVTQEVVPEEGIGQEEAADAE